MDQHNLRPLFSLLRSAITGEPLPADEKALYTKERLNELLAIATKHDLSHLVISGVKQNQLLPDSAATERQLLKAVFRYEQLHFELEAICALFEEANIDFLPLKGSVLREYYPEPWMRTSCDIDILVPEAVLEEAIALLVEKRGYTREGTGANDVSLRLDDRIHVELHYTLVGEGAVRASGGILEHVWQYAAPMADGRHRFVMPEELFYFYHIAHMAKHFENGGCGIRPFIDLWILDHRGEHDVAKCDALLRKGDLLQFAQVARRLSRVWFGCEAHTPLTEQMASFILFGGAYGTPQNRIAVRQQKRGGRLGYAFSRIFVPYRILKYHYPILQKHRALTPFVQVYRWFRILFGGKSGRALHELRQSNNISRDEAETTRIFLQNIGL